MNTRPSLPVSHLLLSACPCGALYIGLRADHFCSDDCRARWTRRARSLERLRAARAENIAIQARRGIDRTLSRPAPGIVERLKGALDD